MPRIRLKAHKMLDVDGINRRHKPGDVIQVGKQYATELIRAGEAEFVEGEEFDLVGDPAIVRSTPRSGQRRVYDIRLNAAGNIEYEFEDRPEP